MRRLIAAITLLILFTAQYSFVQKKVSATGGTTGLQFTGSVSSGHLIVVGVVWTGAETITGVGDAGADTFTLAGCPTNVGDIISTEIAYTLSSASGTPTITPTFSSPPSGYSLFLYDYSYSGTAHFDVCSLAQNASANITSSSLVTANANELIVTLLNTTGGYNAVPSGFSVTSEFLQFPVGATYEGDATDLLDAGTAGSNSINWSLGSTTGYVQTNAAFYVTGGGGGGLTPAQKSRGFFHLPK